MKKDQKGFSLIELLIVVTIIGIIAAIGVPNLLASRRAANEAGAISNIRSINTAQQTYYSTKGSFAEYATLFQLNSNFIIDQSLASATTPGAAKSGYYYTMSLIAANETTAAKYVISANPAVASSNTPAATGTRRFCTYSDGVVRFDRETAVIVTTDDDCSALNPLN